MIRMMRFVSLLLLLFVISCAGTVEKKSSSESHKQSSENYKIPEVSGDVTLTFLKEIGSSINIKSPWGISFAVDGTLYICDRDNSSIIRIDKDGKVLSQFSGFDSRTESLFFPLDISISGGIEVYALDSANSRVLRFDRNLKNAYTIYKTDSEKGSIFGTFNGLAFDKISGDLFVTDRNNGTVIRIDMFGGNVHSSGSFGSEKFSLQMPAGLDVSDNGTLYIADRGGGAVAVSSHFGAPLKFIGGNSLEAPIDVSVLPDDLIAVADKKGVVILSTEGSVKALAGFETDRTMSPRSVAFSDSSLYISDARSSSILVYTIGKK